MGNNLPELAKLIRYYSLVSTTEAGSGHPTSSLSAADLMTVLMFGASRTDTDKKADADKRGKGAFFHFDLENPQYENNDRLIFSKGHASPLFFSLYAAAGQAMASINQHATESPDVGADLIRPDGGKMRSSPTVQVGQMFRVMDPKEMLTLRKFTSRLEGHPTLLFPYTEVPTGSLGQGLSVGVGMALNAKLDKLDYRTFVLMGDSETAEGSIWEAAAAASFYKLDNLIGILDVNRLGQSRETMLGHHTEVYEARFKAFGWNTIVVDGHDLDQIGLAYSQAVQSMDQPTIIIGKTLKGKGVSFIENKDGWHGKALSKEELVKALEELGPVDKKMVGEVAKPSQVESKKLKVESEDIKFTEYPKEKTVATRKAYGNILPALMEKYPNIVVMDGETSNSTYSDAARKTHPERYIEMFIAEQNMVGVALGLSRRGKIPFISTFAAFFSRAFDQIRMSQYADSNIKFVGSHAGVSIGEDGASQMGLEEIAMFRTLLGSVVLYPSDAISTEKLIATAAEHHGNVYIQTTRKETAILYSADETFAIGGSKTIRSSEKDVVTVIGAGVTLHEALAAYEDLKKEEINIRVIDLYSVKPIDIKTLKKAAQETKAIIVAEDHFAEGGLYEAVTSAISAEPPLFSKEGYGGVYSLAVRKMPRSGKPQELLEYEEIDKNAIIRAVKKAIS